MSVRIAYLVSAGILKGEWVTGKEKHVHRTQIPSPLPVIIYRGITPELKKL
jgi:hypothetical protein